jgi:hypothetical protein
MMDAKVHGNTKKAADMALARREEISRDSQRAVHEGRISLAEAKELGRSRGPDTPERRSGGPGAATEGPRKGRECLCSCGGTTRGGRFLPGHDMCLYGELKRNLEKDPLLRNERFTDKQREYAKERSLI